MVLRNTWVLKKIQRGYEEGGGKGLGRSLVVVLLGKFVVARALLAGNEASQAELGAGLLRGHDPLAERRVAELFLARGVHLLRDDLSALVLNQIFLGEAALGAVTGTAPYSAHAPDPDLLFLDDALSDLLGSLLAFRRPGDLGCLAGSAALGGALGRLGDLGGLAGGLAGHSLRGPGDLGGLAARDAFGGTALDGHLGELEKES